MKSLRGFGTSFQNNELILKCIDLLNRDLTNMLEKYLSNSKYVSWLQPVFLSSVVITSLDETTRITWCQWLWQKKIEIIGTIIGVVSLGISLDAISLGVQKSNFLKQGIRK